MSITARKSWKLILFIAFTGFFSSDSVGLAEPEVNIKISEYPLPNSLEPILYDLRYHEVSPEKSSFLGTVTIKTKVKEDTNEIVFHAGELLNCSVKAININKPIPGAANILHFERNKVTEKFLVILNETLKENYDVDIILDFEGKMRDDLFGVYKSSYLNHENQERFLAATQFQFARARHAFPCFDEPRFKAQFNLSLMVPGGYGGLSNMPVLPKTEPFPNAFAFETTLQMATHHLAFVVSDFSSNEFSAGQTKFQLWSRDATANQRTYALNIANLSLDYFEKIFEEKYPLPKVDLVALPDSSSNGMENWGLLTFHELNLLFDAAHTSVSSEQNIVSNVINEVAHSWFGNLIPFENWSHHWLNKGLASYFNLMVAHQLKPEWKLKHQFIVDHHQSALRTDSHENSKPLKRVVDSPSEINSMLSPVTHKKGSSVVRMMVHAFGHHNFIPAVKSYIKEKKYGSVNPNDLWHILQSEITETNPNFPLKVYEIMNSWANQPGYPLVLVSLTPDEIKFNQERFFVRNHNGLPTNEVNWHVPITWMTPNETNPIRPVFWLSKQQAKIKNEHKADWIILNPKSTGFYRVLYDNATLNKIIRALHKDHTVIDERSRAGFIDDLLHLAKAEKIDYGTAFRGLGYLKKERHYLPIKSSFNALDHLIMNSQHKPLRNYTLSLISDAYNELSFDDDKDDDHLTILLRQELNNRACSLGHPDAIAKAQKHFYNWRTKNIPVPKNHRAAIYSTAIKHGNHEDWQFLFNQHRIANLATERTNILKALGHTKNHTTLETFLLNAITKPYEESLIRKNDLHSAVFHGIQSSSAANAYFLAEFAEKHYDSHLKGSVANLLSGALHFFPTKRLIDKVGIFAKNKNVNMNSSLQLANFENNFSGKHSDTIGSWIRNEFGREHNRLLKNTVMYRLPGNIIPEAYALHLEPNLQNATFTGSVAITANVKNDCNQIVLHSHQLEFRKDDVIVELLGKSNVSNIPISGMNYADRYHFNHINLGELIPAGSKIIIKVNNYKSNLKTNMKGFFMHHYKDTTGKERRFAALHLEPTGARRVFPCLDEPALKATFDVSVVVPDKTYRAISNMDLAEPVKDSVHIFKTTPKMSPHSIALVVSDLDRMTDESNKFSIHASPLVKHQLNYSLGLIKPIVKFFEEKLGIEYGLPKLDMVALPDFPATVKESWGLLTFPETSLIYNPGKMSIRRNMQAIRNSIAHGISHQWFGQLVTPDWWNHLWLSKGFASYFEHFAHTDAEKLWDLEDQFVVRHLQPSMVRDAADSTHPVVHDVWSPQDIRNISTSVAYSKAGSLIRMVQNLMGEDNFYKALNAYLTDSQFGTGTPRKLFHAFLKEIAHFDVKKVMQTYVRQPGFPVVDATFDGKNVTLKQSRFSFGKPKGIRNSLWTIPITHISKMSNGTWGRDVHWLEDQEQQLEIPDAEHGWVILNANQLGYYKVNYDNKTWNKLIAALHSHEERQLIPMVNRAAIIDDLISLGRAGKIDYATVFSGLNYLPQETNYIPWKSFFNHMAPLMKSFEGRPEIYELYKFIVRLLEPNFKRLGFKELKTDFHTDAFLRHTVHKFLGKLGQREEVNIPKHTFENEPEIAWPEENAKSFLETLQRNNCYC